MESHKYNMLRSGAAAGVAAGSLHKGNKAGCVKNTPSLPLLAQTLLIVVVSRQGFCVALAETLYLLMVNYCSSTLLT